MYPQKVISRITFFYLFFDGVLKVNDENSRIRIGSESISQRHGSADPDPHQNVVDPEHCSQFNILFWIQGDQAGALNSG